MVNALYNDDCFNVFYDGDKIKPKSVDLVMVDLPYGQIKQGWDCKIDLALMWATMDRVCKDNCQYLFFCNTRFGYELIKSREAWFRYDLVYQKPNSVGWLCAKKKPMTNHEMIYVFNKSSSNDANNNQLGREYYRKMLKFINAPTKKVIHQKLGHGGAVHCLTPDGLQFSKPTEKTYNDLIEHFNIDKMDGFIAYADLSDNELLEARPTFNVVKKLGFKNYATQPDEKCDKLYGKPKVMNCVTDGSRYQRSCEIYTADKGKYHPTQKPQTLCEYLVKTYSNEGDLVMDFTMGSGSTIVACKTTGRNYIGIEKEKEYFDIACERVNSFKC